MKTILVAILAAVGLAACGDITRPVQQGGEPGQVQAPSAPSLNTSGANLTVGDIYGPGWPNGSPLSIITQPGNYTWHLSSTSYNALQPLKHAWQVSGDGGATWHQEHEVTFYSGAWGTVTSQFTRYIPPTANVPFLIRVVATHAGETAVAGPLYVPVDFDFTTSIDGPGGFTYEGTQTWEAIPVGGTGSYEYQWSVYWYQSGFLETLGTAKTQSLYLVRDHGSFELRLTVTSGGETISTAKPVCNFIPPTDYSCT